MTGRGRLAYLGVAGAAMAASMVWWGWAATTGRTGLVAVLAQPPGTDVVLSLVTVRAIDGPDRYTVGHAALAIPVIGPVDGLTVGEELTVGGSVGAGAVVASWIAPAPDRTRKKRLGLTGIAVGAALAFASLRYDRARRGLMLRGG